MPGETYSLQIRKPPRLTARRAERETGRCMIRYIASLCFHYGSANGSELRFASVRNSFSFSPDPLLPALSYLRTSNNPPPPGRGTSRPISVRMWQAATQSARFPPCPSALSRCSFAIARYCPFLLASAHSRFLPFHGIPLPIPLFVSGGGTGSGFRFAGSTLFACFNRHGKGGEGLPSRRLLPAPPVSPFLLACLRLFSFPYFPGMVMGYSVATVMYFS